MPVISAVAPLMRCHATCHKLPLSGKHRVCEEERQAGPDTAAPWGDSPPSNPWGSLVSGVCVLLSPASCVLPLALVPPPPKSDHFIVVYK